MEPVVVVPMLSAPLIFIANPRPCTTRKTERSYQRSAVPFNVLWKPGKPEPLLLPELLTPGIVLDAIKG